MAMTQEERQEFETLKKTVESLLNVANVPFIGNLERRVGKGILEKGTAINTTLLKAVNEAGSQTYDVAKAPDSKLEIRLGDGSTKYIGIYNA